jgi:hypothetical protein
MGDGLFLCIQNAQFSPLAQLSSALLAAIRMTGEYCSSFREYTRCCRRGGRAERGAAQGANGVATGWASGEPRGLAANGGAEFDH